MTNDDVEERARTSLGELIGRRLARWVMEDGRR